EPPAVPASGSTHDADATPIDGAETSAPAARAAKPAAPPPSATTPPGSPVRRASRQAFDEDLQVLIDGSPATLIDLSISGAQVVSQSALKPNRMVKVQLPAEDNP